MVLCDIGNTTFSFFDLNTNKKFKIAINSKLPQINKTIYFISVNDKATKKFLKKYPKAINCNKFVKLKTKYKNLGIDRKIICSIIENGIIVDVGSAISVDVMKNGKHKGGFILAGIKNLISFYPLISSKLNCNLKSNINLDILPTNTNDAINYAIFKSIVLPIQECKNKYKLPIIFTGGDAKYLIGYFKNSKYKKYLIFKAMRHILTINKVSLC
jgi:type III pantothenate kinase